MICQEYNHISDAEKSLQHIMQALCFEFASSLLKIVFAGYPLRTLCFEFASSDTYTLK